jgi:hypothetical protein
MANLYDKASFILTANAYSSSKLFSVKPTNGTGDLTFTRASSGSRINSNGVLELVGNNVPRLTYSGSSCPQFLFEPQRTNLLLSSDNLSDNSYWFRNISNTSASIELISGPYGATISSSKITFGGYNSGQIYINPALITVSQSIYTYSVWVKGINGQTLNVGVNDPNDFTNFKSYSLVTFNGQWQRVTGSYTAPSASTDFFIRNTFPTLTNATVFNVWAPQVELGRYPTSYIPTTTATVTRIEDTSETPGLSSLIGQREGTLFIDYTPTFLAVNNASNNPGILKINNSIYGTLVISQNSSDFIQASVWSGSTIPTSEVVTLFSSAKVNLSSSYKIAFAYSSSNSKLYINGIQNGTSTAIYNTFNTTLDRLYLTDSGFSATVNQNLFKTVAIYKTRLSDSELIALTT